MLLTVLGPAAHAGTFSPFVEGFAVETRLDAPTDARILVSASVPPIVTIAAGPGAPAILSSEVIVPQSSGNDEIAAAAPPAGGWAAGQTTTLAIAQDAYGAPLSVPDLVFTAGSEPAAPPVVPTVTSTVFPAWSTEDREYPWGCCLPVRTVEITVETTERDPWAAVVLRGDFSAASPSQLTTEPVHQTLALAIGPGPHVLRYLQWQDPEVGPLPGCFAVAGVAADGEESAPVEVCEPPPPAGTGGPDPADTGAAPPETGAPTGRDTGAPGSPPAPCGCGATGLGGPPWALLALGAARSRRRAPGRCAPLVRSVDGPEVRGQVSSEQAAACSEASR